jgi:putative acetyltransferase
LTADQPGVLPSGIRIRAETTADAAAIGLLHDAAFDDPQVALLVEAVRASDGYVPALALVAELADESGTPIVGHVMTSRAELVTDDGEQIPILMLSPLGVLPDHQRRGIGLALSQAVLAIADLRPEPLVVVQGHPAYYPRLGFVRGRTTGILPPAHLGAIDRAWMVRRRPGSRSDLRGRVSYPQAFRDLD